MSASELHITNRRTKAYVGLGSNLDDPHRQIQCALSALASIPHTSLLQCSSLYSSAPMGPGDQPYYINAVASLQTRLTAAHLLDELQSIERRQGRIRGALRWGPRTLDLDLLVYGDTQIANASLTLPHPGIAERAFVLYPLHEIAPDLEIPGLGALGYLLQHCPPVGLERL